MRRRCFIGLHSSLPKETKVLRRPIEVTATAGRSNGQWASGWIGARRPPDAISRALILSLPVRARETCAASGRICTLSPPFKRCSS